MRKALFVLLLLGSAACSQGDEQQTTSSEDLQAVDATEDAAAPRPPGVTPTAAPGVAFNYRYAFRLPAARIGPVQEQHAQACEKLGVARCRITAMHYRQDGDDDVQANLQFKLDPALARAFGREGIDAVVRAEGELRQADITGTDVGSQISESARTQAQLRDELQRIEQQLARSGLSASERSELQRQAQEIRGGLRSGEAQQTERRQQLATTPVAFHYEAGDTGGRLANALDDAGDNFIAAATTLLVVLVTLAPWIAAGLLFWILWRWINRRWPAAPRREDPETLPPEA